jgi:UDP-GlcNAc:undecaprenyl-phosphate GlcNAc-1-phosphate transferase
MIGAILGFLIFNIYPSKMFMGDAGSQFIGLFVAFFGINNLWNVGGNYNHSSIISFAVVLVVFTPAAVDTLTVVINRLKKGQSPMVGGKDHTTHHLVYAGLSDRSVWLVFVLISALSLGLSLLMVFLLKFNFSSWIYFFLFYPLLVFYLLYRNTIKKKVRKN